MDLLEATTPEQIWLADLDAIEHLLDERDKSLGFDEKRSCGKTKINTTVAKNKYAKRKLDEDEVSSNVVVLLIHAIVDQRNNNFLILMPRSGIPTSQKNLTNKVHLILIPRMTNSQQRLPQPK